MDIASLPRTPRRRNRIPQGTPPLGRPQTPRDVAVSVPLSGDPRLGALTSVSASCNRREGRLVANPPTSPHLTAIHHNALRDCADSSDSAKFNLYQKGRRTDINGRHSLQDNQATTTPDVETGCCRESALSNRHWLKEVLGGCVPQKLPPATSCVSCRAIRFWLDWLDWASKADAFALAAPPALRYLSQRSASRVSVLSVP